jgi:sugar lactone lactonase YvrE
VRRRKNEGMPEINGASHIEPVGDVVARLGEGPFWDPPAESGRAAPSASPAGSGGPARSGGSAAPVLPPASGQAGATVLWVDIPGGRLHRTVPASGETVTANLGAPVSAVLPVADGSVLVSRQHRLVLIESGGGERTVAEISAPANVRFNDAATDPRGRVWVGSMDINESSAVGVLYRLDRGEHGPGLTQVVTDVTVSNGLGWSPGGSRLYYVDSPARRVDVFDYDLDTGGLSSRRTFADLGADRGLPDGLTVDAEGGVWVALHGGGVLHRYQPDGRLDRIVALPVTHVTSCAFGGPDLADLYVTSAREPLSGAERAAQPLAGRLLRLRPGPAGLPQPYAVLP